jgi:hypothetical protein
MLRSGKSYLPASVDTDDDGDRVTTTRKEKTSLDELKQTYAQFFSSKTRLSVQFTPLVHSEIGRPHLG